MTRRSPATKPSKAITARTPDDLVAAVPVLMGFTPEDSVAMLTLGANASFHARVDLPRDIRDWNAVIDMLLAPVLDYQVDQVAFVFYAAERALVRSLAARVVKSFEAAGVYVVDALHADGSRWYPVLPGLGKDSPGVPYDSATNPIALEAVVDGQVMFPSREALAASLLGDDESIAAVEARMSELPSLEGDQVIAEAAWVRGTLLTEVAQGGALGDDCCARVLRGLTDIRARDAAWVDMTRENAQAHVRLWTDIVRRTPTRFLAAPATLLAFAAWLSGHGALAWCALDRCREDQPHYPLAQLLARMLDAAVPPSAW